VVITSGKMKNTRNWL